MTPERAFDLLIQMDAHMATYSTAQRVLAKLTDDEIEEITEKWMEEPHWMEQICGRTGLNRHMN